MRLRQASGVWHLAESSPLGNGELSEHMSSEGLSAGWGTECEF